MLLARIFRSFSRPPGKSFAPRGSFEVLRCGPPSPSARWPDAGRLTAVAACHRCGRQAVRDRCRRQRSPNAVPGVRVESLRSNRGGRLMREGVHSIFHQIDHGDLELDGIAFHPGLLFFQLGGQRCRDPALASIRLDFTYSSMLSSTSRRSIRLRLVFALRMIAFIWSVVCAIRLA